jgi:hypothetical protein
MRRNIKSLTFPNIASPIALPMRAEGKPQARSRANGRLAAR